MKSSPIQLLESFIEKFHIEANPSFDDEADAPENTYLQSFENCSPAPDYWEGESPPAGLEQRTFKVKLGVRSDPDKNSSAYIFEMVCSGVVACTPEIVAGMTPAEGAKSYGLAILYGVIREHIQTTTGRMIYGPRLLPTASFMPGPSNADDSENDTQNRLPNDSAGSSEPKRIK